MSETKHIICYSGGHSSALAALEVAHRFGTENMTLLNHDIHFTVEHADIKRFKHEVAEHLGLEVTYANYKNAQLDQFDVCVEAGAFKVGDGTELCTNRLKTRPFMQWLADNKVGGHDVCYYGFDPGEKKRIQRRSSIMAAQGYRTDFPVALWPHTVSSTEEVGIARPLTYGQYKHGNCVGCLKAGWQHWYIVYCTRPDIWLKAKWAEDEIGYAIHHSESGPVFLADMEPRFEAMKAAGIEPTEHIPSQRFWTNARKVVPIKAIQERDLPCECAA